MKILMIGGTRFFGKRFVQLMLDQGHAVTLVTRGLSSDDFAGKVTRLIADRTIKDQLKNVITTDYDVVVDNMLMNAQEASDAVSVFKDRIKHYVMTSTLSVYAPQTGPLDEKDFEAVQIDTITPHDPGEAYQHGKRAAEHVLLQAPFGVSIMRIPIIVGPEDYTGRLLSHVKAVQEGKKLYFPNPDAKFSYLHAQDAARALAWLCQEKLTGVINISSPNAWTLRELMGQIEQSVGKKFIFGDLHDTPSYFGITEDYYMNTDKARKAGFLVEPLENWMPKLIKELI